MKRLPIPVLVVAGVLLAGNILASALVGLGDGEALYFCYGQHPSLSYLDHPPLLGWLLKGSSLLFGPSIFSVRLVSAVMTVLSIVFTYLLTRDIFGRRAARFSVFLVGATPVFSVGMVAATPDAPLSVLWILFTWQLHLAGVDERTGPWTRFYRPVFLGAILGMAFLAKYTGFLLVPAALMVLATRGYEKWRCRFSLIIGVLIAGVLSLPVLVWNVENDFVGVSHRLVWTQGGAGFSFRNFGALVGGQVLYVGPLMLGLFALCLRWLWRRRDETQGARVLLVCSLPALAVTYLLSLWSDVAEPHWPAVGYLPLFAAAGGFLAENERYWKLARVAVGYGLVVLVVLHIVVLTPLLPAWTPETRYQREYDLGNELRGWPELAEVIRRERGDASFVVAAFYTQCSQLFFALDRDDDPKVRCISEEMDDFDTWYPSFNPQAHEIIFVTDNRFSFDPGRLLPNMRAAGHARTVPVYRGGIAVREFEILKMSKR